jgi:DNA-binding MarR family transcriptional regulator
MRAPEDDVLLQLARTVVGLSARAADQLGRISVVQLRALTVLRGLGGTSLGRLAAGMGVAPSTASRLVDRLVAAGLAVREPAPHSRRELVLTVTGRGQEVLDRYDGLRLAELRTLLDALPPERREPVLTALAEFSGSTPVPA